MNQNYIVPNPWSIIEDGFIPKHVKSSESIFSIGNGAMGQRGNFEETYTGDSFQGSYIAGVYYPDKTKVGWWKNGYPEYFAKVLNAPSWIGIKVVVNDVVLDLNTCKSISDFRRELNMKEGWLSRSFTATLTNDVQISVKSLRFLSLAQDEIGAIRYQVTPLNCSAEISFEPFLDSNITNQDKNWDDQFWNILNIFSKNSNAFIEAETMKTGFKTCTFMHHQCTLNQKSIALSFSEQNTNSRIGHIYLTHVDQGSTFSLEKIGGYISDRKNDDVLQSAATAIQMASKKGFDTLLEEQIQSWAKIWQMADITIEGDIKAQQAIRFNIFQLNQTYLGTDPLLNIGPKGFTGEKYGGSTYWDTEAYCLPFYMATKSPTVAKNLLEYRFHHLGKAIENAEKLGFNTGAALYPMVTMNGEECHNEWEITFEEIHRNGAIAFAIFNYQRYTGDMTYTYSKGIFVLIAIARFWYQRFNFSEQKQKFVMLGVTGPNEYENNVNNNFYTNYIAKWCMEFTLDTLDSIKDADTEAYHKIVAKTKLTQQEIEVIKSMSKSIYLPYSKEHGIYLQQDGFLDKSLTPVSELSTDERPINQHWSWDRILRSPYIKQADTLQAFYFFEDAFTTEELEKHFDFYEPLTVHESSLSPCLHSIQAAKLGRMNQAYEFYLQTSRLDLDDYNHEVHEGLHITSMAGTWMSIVEGFGGMRIKNNQLHFSPQIPKKWQSYSFKINFRGNILKAIVQHSGTSFEVSGDEPMTIIVNGQATNVEPNFSLST
ncbi:MAG: Maltose phosphorylase [Formosa sp. Hel3_A1_48]|jgi:maltose phosphorylase|nr:MAG: Maltose phosphorylase [Formosa sp. Hel3_A1_48]